MAPTPLVRDPLLVELWGLMFLTVCVFRFAFRRYWDVSYKFAKKKKHVDSGRSKGLRE